MGEVTVRASLNIAHTLLAVDANQRLVLSPRVKLHASILAILNLIPSGLSEHLLQMDAGGYYLSIFLFSHSVAYLLLALSQFGGNSGGILTKVEVFPTSSMSRILFVVISTVRHPFSIALLASNSFFFLVLYRSSIVTGILSVALYLMLMMSVSSLSATLFLILERRKMSPELTLVFATLVGLGGLAASLVFHSGTIINSVPLLSMCLDGIRSALTGDYAGSVVRLLELAAVPVAAIVIGWRLA